MTNFVIFLWFMVLSLAQILTAVALYGIRKRWDSLESREVALDNAERMERLMDLMQRQRGILEKDIHRAAAQLLEAMETDPVSRSNHFVAMQMLRAKLAQQ
ncbi:MAG: hypothetical protein JST45_05345 [Bacteroidetes bacterium]|nr:hypothetical protein [Bacteroidota bacterium]